MLNKPLRLLTAGWMATAACVTLPVVAAHAQSEIRGFPSTMERFDDSLVDAADQGNLTAVKSLIQSGKFVDSKGRFSATPLMRATYGNHADVAAYLLSVGANPNLQDVGGATAMHLAARKGQTAILQSLMKAGANANMQDNEGWTPLMRAALHGHDEAALDLILHGANVNLENHQGETALQHATFAGEKDIVTQLVAHGADVTHRDKNGLTAADIAFQRGHGDITTILSDPASVARAAPSTASPFIRPPNDMSVTAAEKAAPSTDTKLRGKTSAIEAPAATEPWERPSLSQGQAPLPLNDEPADESPEKPEAAEPERIAMPPSPDSKFASPAAEETPAPVSDPLPLSDESGALFDDASPTEQPADEPSPQATPPKGIHFLLQLGTFDDRITAKNYWNTLRTYHADLLGALEPIVTDVLLRSENRTVYRTQAGYLERKEMAQALCSKLVERRVDCFVIESAEDPLNEPPAVAAAEPARVGLASEASLATLPSSGSSQGPGTTASDPHPAEKETYAEIPRPTEKDVKESVNLPWLIMEDDTPVPVTNSLTTDEAPPAPKDPIAESSAEVTPAIAPGREAETQAVSAPPAAKTAPEPQPPLDLAALPERSTFSADVPPEPEPGIPPATPLQPDEQYFRDYYDGSGPYGSSADTGVLVAEAIRVPLSDMEKQQDREELAEPRLAARITLPSENTYRTSSWLQLTEFEHEDAARAFWDKLGKTNPELTNGLRFRVTQPFTAIKSGGRISVRVGPVETPEKAKALCDHVKEMKLTCQMVNEVGDSAAFSTTRRSRGFDGEQPISSQRRTVARDMAAEAAVTEGYWAMLGTFNSREAAEERWAMLLKRLKEELAFKNHDISPPNYSSSAGNTQRLRVGPFSDRRSAAELCTALQRKGVRCLTLKD